MHELFLELFPYLILLYLIDGVALIQSGRRFFVSFWGRRFHLAQGTMAIVNPFPLGQSIIADDLRLLLTTTGLYTIVDQGEQPSARYQPADFHFTAYSDIHTIEADGTKLKVNQATVYATASPRRVQRLVTLLTTLQNASVDQRVTLIKDNWDETQDLVALQERHAATLAAISLLRPWSFLFFVVLFVLLPLTLYGAPWLTLFLPNVLLLLGLTYSICLLLTLYLYRQIQQTTWGATLFEQVGLLFSPVSAIRAIDHLTRTLYSDYEAIMVAALLLPTPAFAQRLRQELYRAECAKVWHEQRDWQAFWTMRIEMLDRLGEQRELTRASIFAAPDRQDISAAAYCPICHGEFRAGFTLCRDCATTLQSYPTTN